MAEKDFTTSFSVDKTPKAVFNAITNVPAWWSGEIRGNSDTVGAEFDYRYADLHYSRQRVTELVPGKKVVWHVTKSKLRFGKEDEWTGTDVVFEIAKKGEKTEVRLTHKGLVPSFQCYGDCSGGWTALFRGNLRKLITTGKPQGDPFADDKTGD